MLTIDGIISKFYIKSYNDQKIEISENISACLLHNRNQKSQLKHIIESSCYLSFDQLILDFKVKKFSLLSFESLQKLNNIEMLIIGTGKQHLFPVKELYGQLDKLDYSIDFMNTPAACRTFNILVNENRKVGALLFL